MFKEEEEVCLLYHDEDARLDYQTYQEACVVSFALVEDEQAQVNGELLMVYLDNCGNVRRHCRVPAIEAASCVGVWRECTVNLKVFGSMRKLGLHICLAVLVGLHIRS
jgi:hypothetical protein